MPSLLPEDGGNLQLWDWLLLVQWHLGKGIQFPIFRNLAGGGSVQDSGQETGRIVVSDPGLSWFTVISVGLGCLPGDSSAVSPRLPRDALCTWTHQGLCIQCLS